MNNETSDVIYRYSEGRQLFTLSQSNVTRSTQYDTTR